MTQYPDQKDPRSDWIYPRQSADDAIPPQGPPPDYAYTQTHPDQSRSPNIGNGSASYNPYDVPEAGPSSISPSYSLLPKQDGSRDGSGNGSGQGGIMMSLSAFFGNKGPPPMWQRPAPHHLPYPLFPSMCLFSHNKDLSSGFPELPPPCPVNPHPFATHDITEEDWKRFLTDLKNAGSLSPAQRIKSNVIPMVTGMSFLTGFMATSLIAKRMKHMNRQAAGDLVDHWNHYFFGPRRMEVVLCQASERLSDKLGAAPVAEPYQQHMANGLRQRGRDDDSSSSSSSDDDHHDNHRWGFDKHARRAARGERHERRWARRRERRERKARRDDQHPYQLFVTPI